MGMFDHVIVELPLPDGWEPAPGELQTKDLDCIMTTVKISAAGRLLVRYVELEEVPKHERPYPDAEGLGGLFGSVREVPGTERWDDEEFHGWFHFHGSHDTGTTRLITVPGRAGPLVQRVYEHHDYRAKFTDGQLILIEKIPQREPR